MLGTPCVPSSLVQNSSTPGRGTGQNVGLRDTGLSEAELYLEIQKEVPVFIFSESGKGKDSNQHKYIVRNGRMAQAEFKSQCFLQREIRELRNGHQNIGNEGGGKVDANA